MVAICDWDFGMTASLDLIKYFWTERLETCKIWTKLKKNQRVSFLEQIQSCYMRFLQYSEHIL